MMLYATRSARKVRIIVREDAGLEQGRAVSTLRIVGCDGGAALGTVPLYCSLFEQASDRAAAGGLAPRIVGRHLGILPAASRLHLYERSTALGQLLSGPNA